MTAECQDGPAPPPKGMTVEPDADAVFRAAIAAGVLSAEPADRYWAGHYFYMFHDRDGAAWFKHRDTRAHVTMGPRRPGGPA